MAAFDLDTFVVVQPKGLLIQTHPEDKDEDGDVEMSGFKFEKDVDSDNDTNSDNEHNLKTEDTNDDESKISKTINQKLMNLARPNDLSFMTPIEDKITKWKEKYNSRLLKTYKKNSKLQEEDEKWHKNIVTLRKKHKKKKSQQTERYIECGDRCSDFALLGVSRILLKTIRSDLKWNHPTAVQRDTIPLAFKGYDLLINAVTGSGKSGAFIIPILERLILSEMTDMNERRVLIITPTRELAIQLYEIFRIFMKTLKKLSVCMPVIGGVSVDKQYEYLTKHRCDVIVATPGRLIDLTRNYFNENVALLANIEILCLDEADRLLSMGFQPELFEIFKHLPSKEFRQNILCSATLSDSVLKLAQLSLNKDNMKRVSVDPSLGINSSKLTQEFIRLHPGQEKYRKAMVLALLLTTFNDKKCIIFCRTKKETHLMRIICSFLDLKCIELHGDLSQYDRLKYLEQFKNDICIKFIFCTDIASRGIDIINVDLVINMEFPTNIKTYIHRVGRTARAGHTGYSCCFVSDSRKKLLKKLIANNKKGVIKSRTLNHEFVLWCFNKINDIKNETQPLLKSENKERDMRLMHIRLKRSENLLIHKDEIFKKHKKTWIMGKNDKMSVRKEAQRKDLGAVETRKLLDKDKDRIKDKIQRKRELEWSHKLGKKAISIKKKKAKQLREENKTKTGMDAAVDMIKNPFKYGKNIKKNIQIKMKRKRHYKSDMMGQNQRYKSSGTGKLTKFDNKQLKKKMRNKGNKTRFKNRRK